MLETENSLKRLPDGFYNRGQSMDRLETFVAAAFAFAVTTLIISVGKVPTHFDELIQAIKLVPSFAASFAIIVWIWATHANWCRRYGLEDGPTVVMSSTLVFLVLIYIFPLRIIMQGFFSAITGGFFTPEMKYEDMSQIRFMFAFYAVGFFALAINFIGLFKYALSQSKLIELTPKEVYQTQSDTQSWLLTALISIIAFLLALLLPISMIGMAGYIYFLLFPVLGLHSFLRNRRLSNIKET